MMANNLNLGLQQKILKIGYIAFQADSNQHIEQYALDLNIK